MRRRKLLLAVGIAALLGVAGLILFLWLTTPAPDDTWENFSRLRIGMSAVDVEALLGKRYETTRPTYYWTTMELPSGSTSRFWRGQDVEIGLTFVTDRLVRGIAVFPDRLIPLGSISGLEHVRYEESLLDRIRRWLHL